MDLRVILGMGGGAGIVALLLALPALPPAIADEEPAKTLLSNASEIFPPPFDPDGLVKWSYTLEPTVSTEPLRQSTVRKIGYGTTEFVQVVETASGTYSSDGLTSPHVLYPGVHKQRAGSGLDLAVWENGRWALAKKMGAGSFVNITKFKGGRLIVTDDGMCVVTRSSVRC
jgi:hypothetical protein